LTTFSTSLRLWQRKKSKRLEVPKRSTNLHANRDDADGAQARHMAHSLFLGEMLTATAMTLFEDEISRVVTLALFIPLIISSGGNSGSQAATLVIRALALGEVTLRDWWRIVRREVIAGLSLGAILGTIGFLRIAVWSRFLPTYGNTRS
jgi:cation transporter-like permease